MHYLNLFLALATLSAATPVARRGLHNASTLAKCEAAPNCELYETEQGTRIRFKAGMAPGEPGYKPSLPRSNAMTRRDGETYHTNVELGSNSINYGSVQAGGEGGAIHHLYDLCGYSTCDGGRTYSVETQLTDQLRTQVVTEYVVLSAEAQFNGYDDRNSFIESIVKAMGDTQTCEDVSWANGGSSGIGGAVQTGSVYECTQANYISVNWFDESNNLKGYMTVTTQLYDPASGWCSVLGDLSAIVGAFAAAPAIGTAAGAVGGFFGAINALCG